MSTTPPATHDRLAWLAAVLWPSPTVHASIRPPGPPGDPIASYHVLPGVRSPRLLLPVGAPRAAAAALRQFNQGMSTSRRLRRAAVGVGFRVGAGAATARTTLRVVGDRSAPGIEAALREATGEPEAVLAITLGVIRPNAKPVVCVLRPDGVVVVFAKVAWNALTAGLVERERAVLGAWSQAPPTTFVAPRPIDADPFGGFPLGIATAAPQPLVRRGPTDPPLEVVREIADRDGAAPAALAATPGWAALRGRLERATQRPRDDRVTALLDALERRRGEAELPIGSWHGDFAPWNTIWHRGRWTVWDWERSEAGVPVGLDAVHWHVQVASHAHGRDLARAVHAVRPAIAAALAELSGGAVDDVLTWYLTERLARYEEARAVGMLDPNDARPGACLRLLEELT